jgi:hypothetical protein
VELAHIRLEELVERALTPNGNKPAMWVCFVGIDILRCALGVKPQLHGTVNKETEHQEVEFEHFRVNIILTQLLSPCDCIVAPADL